MCVSATLSGSEYLLSDIPRVAAEAALPWANFPDPFRVGRNPFLGRRS